MPIARFTSDIEETDSRIVHLTNAAVHISMVYVDVIYKNFASIVGFHHY